MPTCRVFLIYQGKRQWKDKPQIQSVFESFKNLGNMLLNVRSTLQIHSNSEDICIFPEWYLHPSCRSRGPLGVKLVSSFEPPAIYVIRPPTTHTLRLRLPFLQPLSHPERVTPTLSPQWMKNFSVGSGRPSKSYRNDTRQETTSSTIFRLEAPFHSQSGSVDGKHDPRFLCFTNMTALRMNEHKFGSVSTGGKVFRLSRWENDYGLD